MTTKRITAGLLSIFLMAMLVWNFIGNVGDIRIQVMLGVGVVLGVVYTFYGQLPEWLVTLSGGKIVADDDPGNISPLIYLPILLALLLIGVIIIMIML